MIRLYQPTDLEELLTLWLESTTQAHPFISPNYWQESKPYVEYECLPNSVTFIHEQAGKISGFISILQDKFIGALFVAPPLQGTGIGKMLMQHVQQHYSLLFLEVYVKNQHAHNFYRAMGFYNISQQLNSDTQEFTYIMRWQK